MAFMSHQYVFVLGNTPELSLQELNRYFSEEAVEFAADGIALVSSEAPLDAATLINQLGGTVKIGRILNSVDLDIDNEALSQAVAEELAKLVPAEEKISFGLAEFGRNHLEALSHEHIKSLLVKQDLRARYIDSPRYGMSAAILNNHPKVKELIVVKTIEATLLAVTEGIQDIELWTTKDRGKPYASRKKGMLPPKVARIMVNLAVGQTPQAGGVLLDPFCGSGTVLLEAADRNLLLIGSDTDPDSVEGTKQNIQWFNERFETTAESKVYQSDATQLQLSEKVQYLVTEPFLGKPKPDADRIPNIFKGLEKLYLGAFKNWRNFLAPGATIVIVFPRALAATAGIKRDVSLNNLVDKLNTLGYTSIFKPVMYHRPQAVIAREIHIFQYTPAN